MFDNPQAIELPAEPHPLVAAWMETERQSEEAARKEGREVGSKREDTYMGRRELRISSALLKAAEAKGYGLDRPDGYLAPVSVNIRGQRVEWSLERQYSSRHVPLSKKERKKPDNIARGITTEVVYVSTGTFKIVAKIGVYRKTEISERMHKPFERRIEEVLGRFEKLADAAIEHEIRLEETRREIEEETRARERKRRLAVMKEARWEQLREWTAEWQEAKALRTFIAAVEQSLGRDELNGRETSWLAWAKDSADWLDPLSKGRQSAKGITSWRYEPARSEYELSIWDLD
ncbi:MAG: hypothetical protein WDM81_20930 [Rhizomicrobium sp.]